MLISILSAFKSTVSSKYPFIKAFKKTDDMINNVYTADMWLSSLHEDKHLL